MRSVTGYFLELLELDVAYIAIQTSRSKAVHRAGFLKLSSGCTKGTTHKRHARVAN